MFWIKGELEGSERVIRWHNGRLYGDELAQYRVRQLAKMHEERGDWVGIPTYIRVPRNYLAVDIGALALIAELFKYQILDSGGDLPVIPAVPEGMRA